jgi:hypothetical protein
MGRDSLGRDALVRANWLPDQYRNRLCRHLCCMCRYRVRILLRDWTSNMELIEMPRGTGKTTRVVEWLMRSKSRALLVMSEHEKVRIGRQYHISPKDEVYSRIVTPHTLHSLRGRSNFFMDRSTLAVDELEQVLVVLLGMNIGPITYTERG